MYNLHWLVRQQLLEGRKPRMNALTLRYRRRAIEWVIGSGKWDEITLDT